MAPLPLPKKAAWFLLLPGLLMLPTAILIARGAKTRDFSHG